MGKYDSNNFFQINLFDYMNGNKNRKNLLVDNNDLKNVGDKMDFKDIEIIIVRFYKDGADGTVECLIKNNSLNFIDFITFNVKFFDKKQNLVSVSHEVVFDVNPRNEKACVFSFYDLPSNVSKVSISIDQKYINNDCIN